MIQVIRDVIRVLSMPCKEHTKLFTRQLDEPLPPGVALGLRVHVVYCKGCKRFRRQIQRLREIARNVGLEIESSVGMPQALRESIQKRIDEESKKI